MANTRPLTSLVSNQTEVLSPALDATFKFPSAANMIGKLFTVVNNGTASVAVQAFDSSLILVVPAGRTGLFTPRVDAPANSLQWTGFLNGPAYRSVSSAATLVSSDDVVTATGSSSFAVTLPTAVGDAGNVIIIKCRLSAGNLLTVATTASQTIDDATSLTLARNESVSVVSNGANWEIF